MKRTMMVLGVLQWIGCVLLTLGAVSTESTTTALCAEGVIIFTVFTDWFVWNTTNHA
jgi:hypothetical protein